MPALPVLIIRGLLNAYNVNIINPLLVNTMGGASCPYFRKAEQVRVAYGFKQALDRIESGKVKRVRCAIMEMMCQRNYYYLLRGEKPIFPQMQRKIEDILNQYGLASPVEFDRYEWQYKWNEEP